MYSVFDIFKIGIGPSSSHTLGPMKAAKLFIDALQDSTTLSDITELSVDVHGSLSLTGKGHNTDLAIILGLAGFEPEYVDLDMIPHFIKQVEQSELLPIALSTHTVRFPRSAINFINEPLPLHENGMSLHAFIDQEMVFSQTYYSTGGGFIVEASQFYNDKTDQENVTYPFKSAQQLLDQCISNNISISNLMMTNELCTISREEIDTRFAKIWQTMQEGIKRGCATEGLLAGPLRVPRRAPALHRQLSINNNMLADPMILIDWVNMFALAVSEENAAGGRVVTSPTNGAAGIIPAVLSYYDKFVTRVGPEQYTRFFLAASAIGGLFKGNASISGAEVGCQGEIGVSCSMAAAGLTEIMGGSPQQVAEAAEIAMEHHLGLTCDPVAGQVQVPCIERNAISAMKAINASRMAMRRQSAPHVSLDKVIETMYETGKDMNAKYRETSQGGLAIKIAYTCT
ncbi:L-serine ammonia-lyase [Psychromonas sp. psych-6C06]|uniref:L-serine ammonia-lyase n=1 Tax=Psychromonas sp. psych-6C06 TaxID=2058089 RepID=UPI000C33669A|nr:L-serine ammonia-lyase [Psychromonas sp. psych-6C06]PKF62722.1 L-serine ammonia-lyase [Psychromonas sp. psych-6C06]